MQHRYHSSFNLLAVLVIFTALLIAGCSSSDRDKSKESQETKKSGINVDWFDTSYDPCQDFYHYAVGGWQKANPIPDDKSSYNMFTILDDKVQQELIGLLEQMASDNTDQKLGDETSNDQAEQNTANSSASAELKKKLGDFYISGMDTEAIEKAGLTPLQPTLDSIANIASTDDIPEAVGLLHSQGLLPYFNISTQVDDKQNTRMILYVDQGGLGLPNRDYYISTESSEQEIVEKYRQHVAKMFVLAGDDETTAATEAEAVVALETRLAQASLTSADHKNPDKTYHLMSLDELQALTPDFFWDDYIAGIGLDSVGDINVIVPDFMTAVNDEIFKNSTLDNNKAYMRWMVLNNAAPYLTQDFVNEDFYFNSTVLKGITEQSERSETVTKTINSDYIMGFGLGEVYVEKYFNTESKAMVESIVSYLTKVMEQRIPDLEWMITEETQQEALDKLHNIVTKVGYPAENRDYSGLEITRDGYYQNVSRAWAFEMQRALAQADGPVNPNEWSITPQTVNAYYSRTRNEIVFPAAILQAPFFDPEVDDATNFGAIGMVIAHEMSHGYDTAGSSYDSQATLRDWWQPEEHVVFNTLAQGIKDQYSQYTVKGEPLDGELVCGEAIADLNGVSLALQAYELAWQGKEKPVIDGFTAYERFFLSFAQIWASNVRLEEAQRRLKVDPHAPANYRVNGTLCNNYTFFETYNVQKGDDMRLDDGEIVYMW